jgi:hypothetical protein
MTVFWDVAPCSLVEVYRRFRGSKHLWNVDKHLRDYTAQHPRRQSPWYSPPWEPESHLNWNTFSVSFSELYAKTRKFPGVLAHARGTYLSFVLCCKSETSFLPGRFTPLRCVCCLYSGRRVLCCWPNRLLPVCCAHVCVGLLIPTAAPGRCLPFQGQWLYMHCCCTELVAWGYWN